MNKLNLRNTNKSIIIVLMLLSFNILAIKTYAPASKYKIYKKKNNAEIFLDKINKSRSSIRTIIVNAKVDIIKKYIRIKGNMEITIIYPNKILIKTSVLGFTVSTLLINGNKLYFKDHIKKTLKVRRATKQNISRYIPIKLSLRQFKGMLKGNPPIIAYKTIEMNSSKKLLTLKHSREIQYLKFDKKNNIKNMTLYQNNKKRIDINFSKIKNFNGYNYATKIVFNDYKKNMKSKMQITSIKFNQKIKDSVFKPLSI